ncbi:M16-like peptidase [Streptomyces davaonensis JCM 4913]|uniref:M16-like peptidase n=1 Tax=Streptomyces davaonensis (strain DSM 101723 / JCM 4913 / KCC S-0913 / 768) TaxID=1214101 RepID=K4R744_STRDJ|nr:pitrilysin family protein [Streptomyces davaonensis]CCK28875.1 M16-like peptidase [Streptomyces davaonensis JCM 4913]
MITQTGASFRSAEEIGRTVAGPRPLPPLDGRTAHTMPMPLDTVLPNGLRVIAVRRPSVPMVELRMALPLPASTYGEAATAEVVAATLLRGTPGGGRGRSLSDPAGQGISLDASRSAGRLNIVASAPGPALGTLLDTLAGALTSASYDEEDIVGARARMPRQIAVIRAQPQVIAQEALLAHCYGEVPALQEVPLAAEAERVTADRVRRTHRAWVRPRGAVLVLVGDLDPERAVVHVAAATAGWQDTGAPAPAPELPAPRGGVALVPRAGAVQSQIRLARHTVSRSDDRFPALSLAALAFGGYFSSRLVMNIRETKGLAYRTDCGFQDHLDRLALTVDADTATDVTVRAYGEILAELRRLADSPPSAAEIDAAREYTIGMAMLALTSQAGFAGSVLTAVTLGHEPDRVIRFPELLREVTTGEVAAAAGAFFSPGAFSGVIVGDAEQLEPGLRALHDRLKAHD